MGIYNFIFGKRRVSVDSSDGAALLGVCMKYRYPYTNMKNENGRIYVTLTAYSSERLIYRLSEMGITADAEEPAGLPSILYRCRGRYGLWLGLILAAMIVFSSGRVVWDIRVSGNESLSADEVESVLADCGFRRGKVISEFNADKTEAYALLTCDRLAWLSVNIKGTVAYVEVREKIPTDDTPKPTKPANVVAAYSGTVIEIIAYDGLAEVKAGDEVKKGDLLISGAYGEKTPGLRVTRAAGYVKARTVRSFSVEIPLAHEEKVYTGEKKSEKYVIFFSKPIKVFTNYRNLGASCDKIEGETVLSFLGARLPVSVVSEVYLEYGTVTAYYSEAEAEALAKDKLEELLATELVGAELISRNDTYELRDGSVILTAEIISVCDIALTREFEISYTK